MTDWPQITQTHGPLVWKIVWRLLNNDADASDCFQETFVAAFEFSRRQPVLNWPGLLTRLATSRAINRLRKRKQQAAIALSLDQASGVADRSIAPPETAQENELLVRLREGLAELPADQAQACCLRFLENHSYEQIADDLQVSVNHVGVLLHRAKASLRLQLAQFAPVSDKKARTTHD